MAVQEHANVHAPRSGVYIVEKEFTHKVKRVVGSIFRPRRYPRLRPRNLRALVADGYIRLATGKDTPVVKKPSVEAEVAGAVEATVEVEGSIKAVNGGWYVVKVGDQQRKVQGEDAAEALLAEMIVEAKAGA